jgi:3-hydroxyacyl-CoA dehydrogenase/enoyl-CoA hydratase/3-hydroxybutyryl-CoA epimerase
MNIQRELTADGVCILRFDRPHSPANIFDEATLTELESHIQSLTAPPHLNPLPHTTGERRPEAIPSPHRGEDQGEGAIKGLIFISAKDKIFNAGADLHFLQNAPEAELRRFLERGQLLLQRISELKIPVVAAIHGACVGGGYELALACHYRIASNDRATKLGLPETKLGILPAWGGATRLPRLIGVPRALDVIVAGQTLPARAALKRGMVDEVVPRAHLLAAAMRAINRGIPARKHRGFFGRLLLPVARARVRNKTRGHYPAALKAVDIVAAAPTSPLPVSLRREREAILELAKTEACRQLMRLFFLQEKARKAEPGEDAPIRRVAVIGAGVMGAGIAQWIASRGIPVLLREVDPSRMVAGLERVRKLFSDRRVFSEKEARDGMDRISPVTTDVPLTRVDLVIEAATEKLELKKQIFARLPGGCILATNTSALSIAKIACAANDPGSVMGLHFFNPVHRMQLVEVAAGPRSRPEVVRRVTRFAQQIGKLPVVVKDSPGFVVNRILLPYLVEAGKLFEAGASVRDVDEAMLDFGMPMGPLRLIDEVGVDVAAEVAATLGVRSELLEKLRRAGWLGRKSGRGFYVYGDGKATPVNDSVNKFQSGGQQFEEIAGRLVALMVKEAQACVREQIVASPDDVDLAMVLGTGFAPFRGGPLQLKGGSGD